ncbi:hypothetical protein CRE_28807 [Caenorhabditis remanei]|uniref:K Homology domain-containing protein n=1 Tax=Caenorhabditis remanei TaxID=31234 RepID=E3MK71_CAERE|nr:hypothetical protein CRE_28807 [Caenorhabditis remanei]
MRPADVASRNKTKEIVHSKKKRLVIIQHLLILLKIFFFQNPQRRLMIRRRQEKKNDLVQSKSEGTKKQTPPHAKVQNSNNDPANKKAHEGKGEKDGENLSIKILIPSSTMYAIIGSSRDAVMRNLIKEHCCQIQIQASKTTPATSERICLVKGRLDNILVVIESIQKIVREECGDERGNDAFDFDNTPRSNEIKIVMPYTLARKVVGKAGDSIKSIRKDCGCIIEVCPKVGIMEADTSLDRVVTVAHEDSATLLKSVARVFRKVAKKREEDREEKEPSLLCWVSREMCFKRLREEYFLTGEVGGCPTPTRGHPTADEVRKWATDYEEMRNFFFFS